MSALQLVTVPALPLSASSDMVEVRHLCLSWSLFSTCCIAYRASPQWKRNKERLARHKLDHHLGGLTDQQVYEHYMNTVKPRATRNDVGKQRKGAGDTTGRKGQQEWDKQMQQPASQTATNLSASFPSPDPENASFVSTSIHTCQSISLKRPRASSASASNSLNDQYSASGTKQMRRPYPTGSGAAADLPMPSPSSRLPADAETSSSPSPLVLEVQRLHRTLDLVTAAMMETQDRQDERNRLVEVELAVLKRALLQLSPGSQDAQQPPPSEQILPGQQAKPENKRRQVIASFRPGDSIVCQQPASLSLPSLASHVPLFVLALLRSSDFYHEVQATPLGVNNVLWAYGLTEPAGARSCESKRSIREHMRRESCLMGVRWDEALLSEFDQLVRQEVADETDAPVDGPRFVEWKARVAHSAICIFHEDGRHEMHNPLYLNDFSRVLFCSKDGDYIALLPCTVDATVDVATVRGSVRRHLARIFHVGEQQGAADLLPEEAKHE